MLDVDLVSVVLDLPRDWRVSGVHASRATARVMIEVEFIGQAKCPLCGKDVPVYDHSDVRRWRHLDFLGFHCYVVASIPRGHCSDHGVKQLVVPWAGSRSRFTRAFEEWAIEVLQLTRSQIRAARILRIHGNQIHDIMRRAVERGVARRSLGVVEHLCLDEKSFQKGHRYGTVLSDPLGKRVLWVEEGHDEDAATKALEQLPNLNEVKTVSIDMSRAYLNAAVTKAPNADIVHDRFHVAALLNDAVDKCRRKEVKKHALLKHTRGFLFKRKDAWSQEQSSHFDTLVKEALLTGKAYAMKEVFRFFFEQDTVRDGVQFFEHWIKEVKASGILAMKKVATTFEEHVTGLLNFIKWKVTNAYAESTNALIQEIKTIARGFGKFENFRTAILFFLGKLELNP